jgi:hypothetical protein
MIVVLGGDVSLKDKASIVRFIEQHGGRLLVSELGDATHIGLVDTTAQALADQIRVMPGVSEIRSEAPPYPQVSRDHQDTDSVVDVAAVTVGGAAAAGAFEAGYLVVDRRAASCRRIRGVGRQPESRSLRAGNPHVRDRHPQHV